MFPLTPWVRRLLIANLVIGIVTGGIIGPVLGAASRNLYILLMLIPEVALFRPWTLVTYMFLHAGFGHFLFNMVGLFFFGPRLESRLGSRRFLVLYVLAGIGGAVFSLVLARNAAVVGASGAVLGVLMGFAMFWPRERVYIWGVLPIEAWLLAVLYVFGSIYFGFVPSGGRTAHFAHLGGLVFAFVYLKWSEWRTGAAKRAFQKQLRVDASARGVMGDKVALTRWRGIEVDRLHELNRGEVERLLAKADRLGPSGLTDSERDFLDRMSVR